MKRLPGALTRLSTFRARDVHRFTGRLVVGDPTSLHHLSLTAVRHLDLGNCSALPPPVLTTVIAPRTREITHLSLGGCDLLSDPVVRAFVQWGGLMRVDLSHCPLLTDVCMQAIAAHCPKLEALGVSGCTRITDRGMRPVLHHCPCLQTVAMAHCHQCTDRSIEAMCEELWVEDLDVSYCTALTDGALLRIAQEFTGLRVLRVNWCRKLGPDALRALRGLSRLELLACAGCDAWSTEALQSLKDHVPGVTILRDRSGA